MTHTVEKITRYSLGCLLLLVAINAFGGGYYGMAGARSVPVEWLEGSPFNSYFIPSLILFLGVGGICFITSILVFRRHYMARTSALFSGIIIFGWLCAQIAIIGYVSWMQPATAIAATIILVLAVLLPKSSKKNRISSAVS